jgi:hypothetical protein
MNTREMATQYKMAQWKQIMQERAASGLSIRVFCEERGIARQAYHYWQKKLRDAAVAQLHQEATPEPEPQALVPQGWAQVTEEIAPEPQGLTLRIGRASIEVREGFDEALLASVCKTLMSQC